MKCIAPILAKGYTTDNPMYVPCGRCGYCLKTRQLDWTFRLTEETEKSAYPVLFITPTYADDHLPWTLDDKPIIRKHYGNTLDEVTLLTRDLQLLFKKIRDYQRRKLQDTNQIRYYAAGEYGGTHGRPHYHIILFNCHPETAAKIPVFWNKGRCPVELCRSQKSVSNYVSGYIVNSWSHAARINKRPFSVMSKRPFLGHTYVTRMAEWHKRNQLPYLERGEHKQALPRIFKQKIFTQEELNSFKQPAVVQDQLRFENEIHRLKLLNGPNYDAFDSIIKTRLYHERKFINDAKHTDKYEYHLGTPQRASNALPHHANRKPKTTC